MTHAKILHRDRDYQRFEAFTEELINVLNELSAETRYRVFHELEEAKVLKTFEQDRCNDQDVDTKIYWDIHSTFYHAFCRSVTGVSIDDYYK